MNKKKITVVSLFNGMGTLRQALSDLNIKVDKYYSSEIKPAAIELQQYHFPDVIQVGDINNWREWDIDWKNVDFIGSGSPCQDLSISGNRGGIYAVRSSLFFVFIEILEHTKKLNPNVIFLQENVVSMTQQDKGVMNKALGIEPCRINSNLLTAQNRDRYYWTNIRIKHNLFTISTAIPQPKDKKIALKDIIESGIVDTYKSNAICERYGPSNSYKDMKSEKSQTHLKKRSDMGFITLVKENTKKGCIEIKPGQCVDLSRLHSKTRRGRLTTEKSNCLMTSGNEFYFNDGYTLRLFTQTELERLQGFSDGYTSILSYNKAASLLGDGWTLPVIVHILSFYKNEILGC